MLKRPKFAFFCHLGYLHCRKKGPPLDRSAKINFVLWWKDLLLKRSTKMKCSLKIKRSANWPLRENSLFSENKKIRYLTAPRKRTFLVKSYELWLIDLDMTKYCLVSRDSQSLPSRKTHHSVLTTESPRPVLSPVILWRHTWSRDPSLRFSFRRSMRMRRWRNHDAGPGNPTPV